MDHDFEEDLAGYVLGAMAPEEQRQVEIHLQECEKCQGIVASYKNVTEGLLYAPDLKAPPRSLRARLLQQTEQTSEIPGWRRTLFWHSPSQYARA